MSQAIFGGSIAVTTQGSNKPVTLLELINTAQAAGVQVIQGGVPMKDVESEEVTVSADDTNQGQVLVGPNGSAHHKLFSSEGVSWKKVDPAMVAINDLGNSGLVIYVSWGGPTDRWLEHYRNQKSTRR